MNHRRLAPNGTYFSKKPRFPDDRHSVCAGRIFGFTVSQWLAMHMEANEKPLTENELHSAFELLRKLTPEHELSQFAPLGAGRRFTRR